MTVASTVAWLGRVAVGVWRDQPAFDVSGKHHHRLRARHSLDRTDRADEPLERSSVLGFNFHHQRVLTGHVMAFEHVVEKGDGFLEQRNCFRMRNRNADEGGYVLAKASRVD